MILGAWNVQDLSKKMNEVIYEMKRYNVDIAVAKEKKGQGSENLGEYDHLYSGVSKDKQAQQGVSLLIRKKQRKEIQIRKKYISKEINTQHGKR